MMRLPDVPVLISLDHLRTLDAEAPGTWLAQAKIDGRRRMAYKTHGVWTWHAKNRGDAVPIPTALCDEFESMQWPDGIGLDIEFSGPRHAGGTPCLWVFDQLRSNNEWCGDVQFQDRIMCLSERWEWATVTRIPPHVALLRTWSNPGLCDRYAEQLTNPLSEGLVIRKATSTMIGSIGKCAEAKSGYYKVKHTRVKEMP